MANETRGNGDSFAFPVKDVPEKTDKTQSGWMHTDYHGLTKRELFAAQAMQGLLSSFTEKAAIGAWGSDIELVVEISVKLADALLLALETQPTQ